MPRKSKNPVTISFAKVDAAARRHRLTHRFRQDNRVSADKLRVKADERDLRDLWMDTIPEGVTPLDWLRAWNDGYPDEMAVSLYNSLHPDENEQIELEDEDAEED